MPLDEPRSRLSSSPSRARCCSRPTPGSPERGPRPSGTAPSRASPRSSCGPLRPRRSSRRIAFVRESGADVTVRGGGHSAAGSAVAEGAVMVDLSRLAGVRVDPEARRAYVGGGAILGGRRRRDRPPRPRGGRRHGQSHRRRRAHAERRHGLADVPAGARLRQPGRGHAGHRRRPHGDRLGPDTSRSHVGAARCGHQLRRRDRVGVRPARGEPDGQPGVVLLARRPTPPRRSPSPGTTCSSFPRTSVRWWRRLSAPPEPFVPEEHRGVPGIAVLVAGWGSAEEHAAAVAPLRARNPLFELVTPIPHVALQQALDNAEPVGHPLLRQEPEPRRLAGRRDRGPPHTSGAQAFPDVLRADVPAAGQVRGGPGRRHGLGKPPQHALGARPAGPGTRRGELHG